MDRNTLGIVARAALVVVAMRRSVITYRELGKAIGWDVSSIGMQSIGRAMDAVRAECEQRGEPNLAMLAVSEQSGLSSPKPETCDGLAPRDYIDREQCASWRTFGAV